MLRRLPVFPLFGRGQTQLQPAYVEDVADAIARVMQNTQSPMCYELGGPRVYTYRSLLEAIARRLGKKPLLASSATVFQHPSGTPPRIDRNPLKSHIKMLHWWGPDQRRSGPHPHSRFHCYIRALASGSPTRPSRRGGRDREPRPVGSRIIRPWRSPRR